MPDLLRYLLPRDPGPDADYRARVGYWFRALGLIPLALAALGLALLATLALTLPPLEKLERIQPSLIGRMYAADSTLLREFYVQRRIWTPVERIPRRQIQAVVAIEDQHFFTHWGMQLPAVAEALLPAFAGKKVRGASTLTQQLAKNLFLSPERSLVRKLKEMLLSLEIERTYTKDEILEFYLNQVYLGGGAYGFQAAAERFFSRPLDSLRLDQYALLAGLLQRPEAYRPDQAPRLARQRRNQVLQAMAECRFITRAEMAAAQARPLDLKPWTPPSLDGAPYFVEAVRQQLEKRFGPDFIYTAGADIHTTLDTRVQRVVDTCVAAHLAALQRAQRLATARGLGLPGLLHLREEALLADWDRQYARFDSLYLRGDSAGARKRFPPAARYRQPQAAVVVLDNATGAVVALSGGQDFGRSKFNRALQALRSPGSAFKPIVYGAAVDKGASPGDPVEDIPLSLPDPDDSAKRWTPHDLDYKYEGPMTLRRAFYRSRNIPAIKVALATGLDTIVAYARRFGLSRPMRPVPALGIGACDVTVLEMAGAFAVFPGGGLWREPHFVARITDRQGVTTYRDPLRTREVLRPGAAWILCGMLRDVNIHGTAADIWASGFHVPSGGKTGTTNDFQDAWYVGFTPAYTAAVWIGTDDHQSLGPGHTGTEDALPLWLSIMREIHRGRSLPDFERPPGVKEIRLCRLTGRAAQDFCGAEAYGDYYLPGHPPFAPCTPELHARALAARARYLGPDSSSAPADTTPSGLRRIWDGVRHIF